MSEEATTTTTVPSVHKEEHEANDGGIAGVDASANAEAVGAALAKAKPDPMLDDDVPMTFPQKLFQVVSNEEHQDCIGWLPHGRGFIIYKKKKFAAEILPRYFKQSKYTSFTRKLNRWGFTRVTRGPETGSYFHKFFQRGEPRLCLQMSCQVPKSGVAAHAYVPFPGGKGGVFPADLQSQALIRQQLQQLQLHQFHLQQMQMQQQHMQAAELFRQQQQMKKNGDGEQQQEGKAEDESAAADGTAAGGEGNTNKEEATTGGDADKQSEEQGGGIPTLPTTPVPATNPYLQTLQQAGAAVPLGILPAFQMGAGLPGSFMPQQQLGVPMMPMPTPVAAAAVASPVTMEAAAGGAGDANEGDNGNNDAAQQAPTAPAPAAEDTTVSL